ncbi:IS5 family transposase [Lentzea roselyniae]|uniref:IS5 family transposase n=1 Tax=Lentzea roselyniae TaxID=531940 RepID=A0ABP7CFB2_9PSEU
MARRRPWEVEDELWELIEPLLPKVERRFRYPGRKRLDDRKALCGILFVLYTGIGVGILAAGAGVRVGHDVLAAAVGLGRGGGVAAAARAAAGELAVGGDVGLVAGGGGFLVGQGGEGRPKTGPSPIDRARTGSKHHLITDGGGVPLAVTLTGANRNDVTHLIPLLDAIPLVRGRRGHPRHRPDRMYADRAYDKYREQVRTKGIRPLIARRGVDHGSGLGVHRWVVEQTLALLHWIRRLRIRWEIRDDIHEALLSLACSIICGRRLQRHQSFR